MTSLAWTLQGEYLLSGDDRGVVALMRHGTASNSSTNGVQTAIAAAVAAAPGGVVLWHLRVGIVQIDATDDNALISDGLRTSTLHLSSPATFANALQPLQLGSKTREGPYGACFHAAAGHGAVLAARPGRRMWIADTGKGGTDDAASAGDGATSVGGQSVAPPEPSHVRATLRPGIGAASSWADDAQAIVPASASCSFGRLLPVGLCVLSASASSLALVDFLGVAVLSWWPLPSGGLAAASQARPAVAGVCAWGHQAFALCTHPPTDGGPASAAGAAASVWMLTAPDSGEPLVRVAARAGDVPRAVRLATRFGVMDGDLLLEARFALESKQQQQQLQEREQSEAGGDGNAGGATVDDDAAALARYEALFARAAAAARAVQQQQEASEQQQPSDVAAAANEVFAAMSRSKAELQHGTILPAAAPSSRSGTLPSASVGRQMQYARAHQGDDDSASDTGISTFLPAGPAAVAGEESASVRSASIMSGRMSPTALSQRSASTGTASALRAALAAALPAALMGPLASAGMAPQPAARDFPPSSSRASSRTASRAASPPPMSYGASASVIEGSSAGTSPTQSPMGSPRTQRTLVAAGHAGSSAAARGALTAESWGSREESTVPSAPPSVPTVPLKPRGEFVPAPEIGDAAHAVYAPRLDADVYDFTAVELMHGRLDDDRADDGHLDVALRRSASMSLDAAASAPVGDAALTVPLRRARRRRRAVHDGSLLAGHASTQSLQSAGASEAAVVLRPHIDGMTSEDEEGLVRDDWTDRAGGAADFAAAATTASASATHGAGRLTDGMAAPLSRSPSSVALTATGYDVDDAPSVSGSSLADAAALARVLDSASIRNRVPSGTRMEEASAAPWSSAPDTFPNGDEHDADRVNGGDGSPADGGGGEDVELGDGWARLGGIDWPPGDTSASSSDDDDAGSNAGDAAAVDSDDDLQRASNALDRFQWDTSEQNGPVPHARSFTARLALLGTWDSHVEAAASGGVGDAAVALSTMASDADVGDSSAVRSRAARRRLWAAGGAADALSEALMSLDATHLVAWLRVWLAARSMSLRVEDGAVHDGDSIPPRAVRRLSRVLQLERKLDAAVLALGLVESNKGQHQARISSNGDATPPPKDRAARHSVPDSPASSAAGSSVYADAADGGGWLPSPSAKSFTTAVSSPFLQQYGGSGGTPHSLSSPPQQNSAEAAETTPNPASIVARPGGVQLLADELLVCDNTPGSAKSTDASAAHRSPGFWSRCRLLRGLSRQQQREVLTAALVAGFEDVAADAAFQDSGNGPLAAGAAHRRAPVETLLQVAEDACHAIGDVDLVLRCCTEAYDTHIAVASKSTARGATATPPRQVGAALDATAYILAQRLVQCAARMSDQHAEAAAVLEPLDAHLWAPPPAAVGRFPQLRAVMDAELVPQTAERQQRLDSLPFVIARDKLVSLSTAGSDAQQLPSNSSPSSSEYVLAIDVASDGAAQWRVPLDMLLEEPGHWGVRLRLAGPSSGMPVRCTRCDRPLVAPTQGPRHLAVFPCGAFPKKTL